MSQVAKEVQAWLEKQKQQPKPKRTKVKEQ